MGLVELGGHDCPPNDRSAHTCRFPEALVRLERRDGRRWLPIGMVVMLALHHQRQTCATGRAISSRSGRCIGWKGSWGVLEAGRSAGGRSGSPGCAARGSRRKRGGEEPLAELSAAKGLLCVFALAHPTQ